MPDDGNLPVVSPSPLLDVADPPGGVPTVFTAPYFVPTNLNVVLGPAIENYLDLNLPTILPPYIQPAAEQAVKDLALLRAGDTATGPIYTTVLLPTADGEFATKVYVDTQVASIHPLPEAPAGPPVFGRNSTSGWLQVLPTAGGTLTGALTLSANAAAALQAVPLQQLTSTFAAPPAIGSTTPAAGSFTTVAATGPITLGTNGISFGSVTASSSTDYSKHLALYGGSGGYGINVTAFNMNYGVPSGGDHTFYAGAVQIATIATSSGGTGLTVGAAGAPNIRSGTGAATGTQPAGSLFLRTDGATGTRLYVSAGGGTWNAVAGV